MNIVVNGRNVEVTPSLRQYAEEKIGKFEKFKANISEAVVTLSIQKHRHKTEVLIKANGTMIQAEGVTDELYSSIDDVVAKLDKQIKKLKGKQTNHRKSDPKLKNTVEPTEDLPQDTGKTIVKKNLTDMKPMSPEEASMQMELMDRGFLVFINSGNSRVNVIYRMNDGNFGLIEPGK
jgi:putative sigma-54 modulation protein